MAGIFSGATSVVPHLAFGERIMLPMSGVFS